MWGSTIFCSVTRSSRITLFYMYVRGGLRSGIGRFAVLALAALLALANLAPAKAAPPLGSSSLLKQTQTQNLPGIDGSNPSQGARWFANSLVLNDRVYFLGATDASGTELMTTDGTAAGTYVVKETSSGSSTNISAYSQKLTESNGLIYFQVSNEVWVSNGTAAGTGLLKKLSTRYPAVPQSFTKVGTKTFFVAYDSYIYYADAPAGRELWVTDGTSAGTSLVKDIFPGNYLLNGNYVNNDSGIGNLTECAGRAFFSATDGTNGYELWSSDGTAAGTTMVKDILPGVGSASPNGLKCVNGKLVFAATSSTGGQEPWVSDGTSAGTVQLVDIYAGASSSAPTGFYTSNGKAYFRANDVSNGTELWMTDGTSAGTVLLKNINPGNGSSAPMNFTEMGGKVYFTASDSRGYELWVTDGTTVGTLFVADINQTAPGASSTPKDMYAWNSKLYFTADNGVIGREPWVTDGTNAGTRLIRDMFPGISDMLDTSYSTDNLPYFAGTSAGLFFTANSPVYAQELWVTDGTDAGTRLLTDLRSGPGASYAKSGVSFNGKIYFSASSAYFGQELWSTDLTTQNTQQVVDIYPGAPSGMRTDVAHNMVVYNDRLYFSARNLTSGFELWSTDGTSAGTGIVADLTTANSGTQAQYYNGPTNLTVCNGKLFFSGYSNQGYELHVSDGTSAGTTMVKNIQVYDSSNPSYLVCMNNVLYFAADDSYYWQSNSGTFGNELWRSDGTSAGTYRIDDINTAADTFGTGGITGTADSNPSWLTVAGNRIFFSATNSSNETELYYTDGTTTTKVDVLAGAGSSNPRYLTLYNGLVYFSAYTPTTGWDMFSIDPNSLAITSVDVRPGSSSYQFLQPVVMGGLMWFQAEGEMHTSDGTAANTGEFENLLPSGNSNPDMLRSFGGAIMYVTYDAVLGSQPRYIIGQGIYTVSYLGNGSTSGTVPPDTTVMSISASVAGNTGNLVRTGFRFVGWNTSPTGVGTSYLPGATITPIVDTPLYAQWASVTTYTITYDANGANSGVPSPALTGVDQTVVLDNNSGNMTRAGYRFDGWALNAAGTGTVYAGGSRYTATANVTLYAKWTALPAFSITFNGNGNTSGTAPTSLTNVYSTTTLPFAGTLAKTGFAFAGWNTAANGLGTQYAGGETLTPQANLTLYAQWTANPTYTLTYDANGATSGTVPAVATASSTYVVIDSNSGQLFRTGYVFSGWNSAPDGSGTNFIGGNNYLLNSNITFYAKWTVANHTVTFNGNGSTSGSVPASITGVSVSTTLPGNTGNLIRPGYTFVGWNTLASGLGTDYAAGSTFSPTSSTTLYAKWTSLPTYTIVYDGNGNTGGGVPVAQSGIYASVNLDSNAGALTKTGFFFAGWNTAANGSGTRYPAGSSYTPTSNITLYAEWSATQTYTLTYDGNQKTAGVPPVPQVGITSSTTVLGNSGNLSRVGYRFDGWNTAANGSGTTYVAGNTITLSANQTLYAVWTSVPTFTLTYSGNGQTTGSVPLSVTTSDPTVTLSANINVMTKTNFIFTGWNTAANGTGTHYNVGDSFPLTANTTLYAEWTAEPYTITYLANGATSGTAPAATTASGAQTVAANTGNLALTGYVFSGWNTAADGTGTNRAVGSSFTPTANTSLFARWVTYTITFNANGATTGTAPNAVTGVTAFSLPNEGNMTRTSMVFVGWNTAANGSGTSYSAGASYTPTASVTLYAIWSNQPVYQITYDANQATAGSVPIGASAVASTVTLSTNVGNLDRTGYVFSGWNTAANGSGTTYAAGSSFSLSSNVTLYALWVQQFQITYDANQATSGTAPAATISTAATVTLASNTGNLDRTGFVFSGWNTAANGSGTTYAAGASFALSANVALYALWVPLNRTITYDANGATSGSVPAATVGYGNVSLASTIGTLARDGYFFAGWNTAANGSGTTYGAGSAFALSANTTLYAQWTLKPVVPIFITGVDRIRLPLSGGKIVLTGTGFETVESAKLAGVKVEVVSLVGGKLTLNLPAMAAGNYELTLVGTSASLIFDQTLRYIADNQVTIAGLLNSRANLTSKLSVVDAMLMQMRKYANLQVSFAQSTTSGKASASVTRNRAVVTLLNLATRLSKVYQRDVQVVLTVTPNTNWKDIVFTFSEAPTSGSGTK